MDTGQARATITGTMSATLFSVLSSGRHHITRGVISVTVGSGAGIVEIAQTNAAGSSVGSALFACSSSTPGLHAFDLGDRGYVCEASSRIIANYTGGAVGSAVAVALCVGYAR